MHTEVFFERPVRLARSVRLAHPVRTAHPVRPTQSVAPYTPLNHGVLGTLVRTV